MDGMEGHSLYEDGDLHLVHRGRPRISFGWMEMLHLAAGVSVLTIAFAFISPRTLRNDAGFPVNWMPDAWLILASFLAVTTGFVLHELAHKIVAQRFGHWAEFRAAFFGLVAALGMAIFPGFLVALPGATWIQGNVTRKQSGVISIVGPAVNFVIAWAAFPFALSVNPDQPIPTVFGLVASVNSMLAAFNLIPIHFFRVALDGRKVLRWNPWVWGASFAAAVGTALFINLRLFGLI